MLIFSPFAPLKQSTSERVIESPKTVNVRSGIKPLRNGKTTDLTLFSILRQVVCVS